MALKVLSALDSAHTQWYHFKAIIIAGMGLFTDSYDLFCVPPIMTLLGRIYYHNDEDKVPRVIVSTMIAISLLGTVIGQLLFGRLGDRIGRRRVYGFALMLMVVSSLGCGFSICTTRSCVLVSFGFFRFLLGIGIGGDYPLSATIMSEFANRRTRGGFIAAVFSMQGIGIVASSLVSMIVCKVFDVYSSGGRKEGDIAWRVILMIGAVPAGLTYYWRMMMPETARYTALVEQNILQAAKDMEQVLDISLFPITEQEQQQQQVEEENEPSTILSHQPYSLLSKQFLQRHGRDLFACSLTWFLVDIVFYSSNLFQSQIYQTFLHNNSQLNAYRAAFQVAKLQAIIALCSTIPGYWFTVYFIDKIGRVKIQIMGFFFMAVVYVSIGIPYYTYWDSDEGNDRYSGREIGFMALYGLTFFFANFGPNTTTFIVPAELFPARLRTTCHGISGAVGKVGAMIGAVGFVVLGSERKREVIAGLGFVCVLGMIVTYMFTIETKGRSLEENEKPQDESRGRFFLRPNCFN